MSWEAVISISREAVEKFERCEANVADRVTREAWRGCEYFDTAKKFTSVL